MTALYIFYILGSIQHSGDVSPKKKKKKASALCI